MRVRVTGESKIESREIHRATRFFLSRLLPERVFNQVFVHIKFTQLERVYDGLLHFPVSGHNYRIEINPRRNILATLAHECVHIKQHALRELKPNNETVWKKRKFKDLNLILNEESYYEVPWEKEAYRLEKKLMKEYRCHLSKLISHG